MKLNIYVAIFSCILFLGAPLFARDKSDVIVMNNGDRFTGEIKGLDSGVLYVSFDYIDGTCSVQWSKVHHLESKQLFLVKPKTGRCTAGRSKQRKVPSVVRCKFRSWEVQSGQRWSSNHRSSR